MKGRAEKALRYEKAAGSCSAGLQACRWACRPPPRLPLAGDRLRGSPVADGGCHVSAAASAPHLFVQRPSSLFPHRLYRGTALLAYCLMPDHLHLLSSRPLARPRTCVDSCAIGSSGRVTRTGADSAVRGGSRVTSITCSDRTKTRCGACDMCLQIQFGLDLCLNPRNSPTPARMSFR